MGTSNLTMVIDKDGETKIAQYGQWDGYPSGQGATILNFIRDEKKRADLMKSLSKIRFIEPEGRDKEMVDNYNKNAQTWSNEPDNRTDDQIKWFETLIHRDVGGKILQSVIEWSDDEILLDDESGFLKSGNCEWAYCIDFKENKFKVMCGANVEYDLDNLPSDEEFFKLEGIY